MEGYQILSVLEPPFVLTGIPHPKDNCGEYYRLDASKKSTYPPENDKMSHKISGAAVRFRTDAEKILLQIHIRRPALGHKHVTPRGAYGVDVYVKSKSDWVYACRKGQILTDPEYIEDTVDLGVGMKDVLIELPLYGGVSQMDVGIPEGAVVEAPTPRKYGNIVFYGSSITQGCAASRPGNAYTNLLCRMLDADCRNLGFSSSACGEQVLAEYIAGLKQVSAFVMDYDHNNHYEGLKATHYDFYATVRKGLPDIPILMVTRPWFGAEKPVVEQQRQEVIRASYERARAEGDENVYFVCGDDFFPNEMRDLYSVDFNHPNDLGMYCMAQTIYPVLKAALEK